MAETDVSTAVVLHSNILAGLVQILPSGHRLPAGPRLARTVTLSAGTDGDIYGSYYNPAVIAEAEASRDMAAIAAWVEALSPARIRSPLGDWVWPAPFIALLPVDSDAAAGPPQVDLSDLAEGGLVFLCPQGQLAAPFAAEPTVACGARQAPIRDRPQPDVLTVALCEHP